MASKYGAKHGLPGYDSLRTGLSYQEVYDQLKDYSDDPKDWRYKSRGVVLGYWHQLKMELYLHTRAEMGKKSGKRGKKTARKKAYEPAPF
jgi:hypothetical protein